MDDFIEKVVETRQCRNCAVNFDITDADQAFYAEMHVPAPTFCPDCRQQRRLSFRNERTLYKRKCDATGKLMVSIYSEDKPITVFDNEHWYSDAWNPMDYGRDFDFNRTFAEQFEELWRDVPQLARSTLNNYNCDFVNQCGWSKNCYLTFEADGNQDSMYSNNLFDSRTCVDILYGMKSELCYECIDIVNCYNLKYSQNCHNCSDSWFLKNCIGCQHCFGSVNLRNKQYYFLNQKCTPEEYHQKVAALGLDLTANLQRFRANFVEHAKKYPHKAVNGTRNEFSSGDYLWNTKNCKNSFDLHNGHDCKFVYNARNTKKVYDMMVFGANKGVEFCYENHEIGEGVRNIYFSEQIWMGSYNIWYSKLCIQNSHDLFGCIGLQHKSFCILNKQYEEQQWHDMKARIIEHMKKTGEWGEFHPSKISPFGYNETVANIYYPLTKDQALAKGYKWKDPDPKEYQPSNYQVPLRITEVGDDILQAILACTQCKKNYRIISQELVLYRRHNLPIPLKCHDCRYMDRLRLRNARRLYDRQCGKCAKPVKTTYSPNRAEPVYCEQCYLNATD